MTRHRSSRGRHRRQGERPADAVAQNPDELQGVSPLQDGSGQEQHQAATSVPPATELRAEPHRGPRPAPGGRPPQQRGARPADGERAQESRSGPPRNNRRRQQRRQQIAPMPTEVLKPKVRVVEPREPVQKRTMEEISGPEGPVFGCPMLTRTRLGLPMTGGQAAPRCSLAWALHSETEASYCMETSDLVQCWKAHPERLEEIKARLSERAAAD
jgi:hypothetical protein